MPFTQILLLLLRPQFRPIRRVFERQINVCSGPTKVPSSLDIPQIQHPQVKHLEYHASSQHAHDDQISGETGMVVRRLSGVVHKWTTDITDCKSEVEHTRSRGFLGMAGGVCECP